MFSWAYNFYRKHRKKIIITGVLAGGSYALFRYGMARFEEWQNEKINEIVLETNRQHYFQSNQITCSTMFIEFLPTVRNLIMDKINIEELLDILKLKPANKLEIWEKLKIMGMVRLICSILSCCILLVFLKVHMNVMGGYLFVESTKTKENSLESSKSNIKEQYLNHVKYFIEKGLLDLIEDLYNIVEERLSNIQLKEKISHNQLKQLCTEITDTLKMKTKDHSTKHPFNKYFVDASWNDPNDIVDSEYSKVTSETLDILESTDYRRVLDEQINAGLEQTLKSLEDNFHGFDEDSCEKINSLDELCKTQFYKSIELPYAKIIPLLNHNIHDIFNAGQNDFIDALYSQPLLREFSENIYDAFSTEYS